MRAQLRVEFDQKRFVNTSLREQRLIRLREAD